jgi:hypothetical protein
LANDVLQRLKSIGTHEFGEFQGSQQKRLSGLNRKAYALTEKELDFIWKLGL